MLRDVLHYLAGVVEPVRSLTEGWMGSSDY
jgi:hypothetical protein